MVLNVRNTFLKVHIKQLTKKILCHRCLVNRKQPPLFEAEVDRTNSNEIEREQKFPSVTDEYNEAFNIHNFMRDSNEYKETPTLKVVDKPSQREFNKRIEKLIREGQLNLVEDKIAREDVTLLQSGTLTYLITKYLEFGEIDKAASIFEVRNHSVTFYEY